MHNGDFFAVINGYAGDSDHPRKLLMHTGRKPGKLSLVPRRDECVRYGMTSFGER